MIRAIITDLDGTILPRGGQIATETLNAFHRSGEQGCVRIIATGRSLYAAQKVLPPDFPIDYLVFSSGAGILDWKHQRFLFVRHLERQATRDIATYLLEYNINFTIQREIPDNHYFYYTDLYPVHEDYKHRLETYRPFGSPIYSVAEITGEATQFVMILDARQLGLLEKIRRDLRKYSIVRSTSPVDNHAIWLEIFAAGVNKGNSCRRLLQDLHVGEGEVAGIGNDYNDVDFLEICAMPFVVANAPTRLKSGYKVVASDRENGFVQFVDTVLKV